MTADELVNDPYIKSEDIRLTVFEKAGQIQREAVKDMNKDNSRRFKTTSQSFGSNWGQYAS